VTGNIAKTEAIKDLLATSLILRSQTALHDKRASKAGEPLQTVEVDGFIFQLMKCELSNRTIKFSFTVTSPGKDKKITISGNKDSRIFDYEGNEYGATDAQIGYTKNHSVSHSVTKVLAADIPVKASISFGGIPSKITGIALLELDCLRGVKAQFRNVPLSK